MGVTGRRIVEALIAGEDSPEILSWKVRGKLRKKEKLVKESLKLLRTNTPYRELGDDYFDQLNPARATKRLLQRLQALGHHVQLSTAPGSTA